MSELPYEHSLLFLSEILFISCFTLCSCWLDYGLGNRISNGGKSTLIWSTLKLFRLTVLTYSCGKLSLGLSTNCLAWSRKLNWEISWPSLFTCWRWLNLLKDCYRNLEEGPSLTFSPNESSWLIFTERYISSSISSSSKLGLSIDLRLLTY